MDEETLIYLVIALVALPLLVGLVRGLRGGRRAQPTVAAMIDAATREGPRDRDIARQLDSCGLQYRYKGFKSHTGQGLWHLQHGELGGPFTLFVGNVFQNVCQGDREGVRTTVAEANVGDSDIGSQRCAVLVAFFSGESLRVGIFTAAPLEFAPGVPTPGVSIGRRLTWPSHPQLEKTHRIRGDETARAALSGAVLDLLARDSRWVLEGNGHTLLVCRRARGHPHGPAAWPEPEEFPQFLDEAAGVMRLFRW